MKDYKFKIGDRVRIKPTLEPDDYPMESGPEEGRGVWVGYSMLDYCGKELTVTNIVQLDGVHCYKLSGLNYGWPDAALEPVVNCFFHSLI